MIGYFYFIVYLAKLGLLKIALVDLGNMKRLLMLFAVAIATFSLSPSVIAQGGDRGENDVDGFEAAQRSVENQLVVEEMENAGFELDVEEGFEEEWEEEQWVGSEAEDVDPLHVDPSEAERFDLDEVPHAEEIAEDWSEESWENPEEVLHQEDDLALSEETHEEITEAVMRGEETSAGEDFTDEVASGLDENMVWEEEIETAELNWWEEEGDQWDQIMDDMELDDYSEEFMEEDLDLLEELYYGG